MKTNECLPGWSRHEDYCYLVHGKNYKTSVSHAKFGCWLYYQAHLVSILNSGEQQFVQSLINQNHKDENGRFWIGYTDEHSQKNYRWNDGSTSAYTNWEVLEPNHLPGEDCAVMKLNGKWNDLSCMAQHSYVCKKHIGKLRQNIFVFTAAQYDKVDQLNALKK